MELKERLYILAQDTGSMADLHEYMIETLKNKIVDNAFGNREVTGYAEAKTIIDNVFHELKQQTTVHAPYVNENV